MTTATPSPAPAPRRPLPPRTSKTGDRRNLIKAGTLSAGVLLAAALLLIVNYFGWKYYKRFDWTRSHLYSLSPKTLDVLHGLHRDVDFVVFLPPEQSLYEPTREVLARYAAASPHVHVRMLDPQKKPIEAEQLVRRYNVTAAGVVVAAGADRRIVDGNDLAEFDFSGMQLGQQQPEMKGYKGEQLFTSAILAITEGRKPKVLFSTGHGERSLDDTGPQGLSGAQQILGRDNFQMEEWASLGKPAVPAGTDLVVIAGPTSSWLPPELAALSAYVDGGGRALVLLDPKLQPAAGSGLIQTGLEGWLAGYGVKVGQDIVVDPANPLPFFGAETLFAKDYGEHPITKALRSGSLPVLVSLARSIGKAPEAAGATVTELLRTSPDGWGETDLAHLEKVAKDSADVPGPVSLGVAVEKKGGARRSRLVVFGDSDFATNQLLQANANNSMLLTNSLNWLVERESLLGIPPKKTEQVRLSLTSGELGWIRALALIVLPGLAIVIGSAVHFRRRR
ncbi:MAG: Gldg family protein [Acidobacteriota bacterium]|nr:Gldg family protein [Acidobacteriota bacterium]